MTTLRADNREEGGGGGKKRVDRDASNRLRDGNQRGKKKKEKKDCSFASLSDKRPKEGEGGMPA